ncbi:MAG TPA: hypothetical protein VG847_05065 [Chitinophagaceae bacterium]|nr:hypothetical protein [Chitinophagaceae bacterium]
MNNMELIENYFKGILSGEEKKSFEQRIQEEASFADEVAFYISANNMLRQRIHEEKKQQFRDVYQRQKTVSIKKPVIKIWRYVAAASVLIVLLLATWFIAGNKTSPQQLADRYIKQNLQMLPVTMGIQDSLQQGVTLYNSGKLREALPLFETLSLAHPENTDAKKYAGIVYLRLYDYDKAMQYFSGLEANKNLYSNPGKFLKAITLLKRDSKGDEDKAKQLLNEVIQQSLEGSKDAEEIIRKIK